MPNTNFQTFHQMGQAINEVVRQATGRDNVQNIDMEHITVAQNHYYEDVDVSGSVVSFHAGAAGLPLEKCVVQIEPVQDLHGYDHPWPAGGGKNKYSGENPVVIDNALFANVVVNPIPAGDYVLSGIIGSQPSSGSSCRIAFRTASGGAITAVNLPYTANTRTSAVFTLTEECGRIYFYYGADSSGTGRNTIKDIQIESGSTATAYEPYSNICPITGWTGAQVYVSPTTDAADGQTYSITFPSEAGTVYGGTLDVVSGELVVDRMNIASYNGETFPGKWMSDRDVYVEGATPTTGAQVVYELAEPITYQLTPTEITTLLGVNNIWSDAGDIEVKFTDLKELY